MIDKCLASKLFLNFIDAFQISALYGLLTTVSTFIFPGLQEWFTINESYVNIALGCIAVDHALGTLIHSRMYKNDWNFQKNITGLGVKLSMVVAFAFLMEGLAHITIEDDFVYKYIKMSGRILVILYPAISAMKNMRVITSGNFPPAIFFGKAKDAFESGDIRKLNNDNNAESN
jgi:hypothetical protein